MRAPATIATKRETPRARVRAVPPPPPLSRPSNDPNPHKTRTEPAAEPTRSKGGEVEHLPLSPRSRVSLLSLPRLLYHPPFPVTLRVRRRRTCRRSTRWVAPPPMGAAAVARESEAGTPPPSPFFHGALFIPGTAMPPKAPAARRPSTAPLPAHAGGVSRSHSRRFVRLRLGRRGRHHRAPGSPAFALGCNGPARAHRCSSRSRFGSSPSSRRRASPSSPQPAATPSDPSSAEFAASSVPPVPEAARASAPTTGRPGSPPAGRPRPPQAPAPDPGWSSDHPADAGFIARPAASFAFALALASSVRRRGAPPQATPFAAAAFPSASRRRVCAQPFSFAASLSLVTTVRPGLVPGTPGAAPEASLASPPTSTRWSPPRGRRRGTCTGNGGAGLRKRHPRPRPPLSTRRTVRSTWARQPVPGGEVGREVVRGSASSRAARIAAVSQSVPARPSLRSSTRPRSRGVAQAAAPVCRLQDAASCASSFDTFVGGP